MKIVVNTSNLHSGGGLQVGISFIYEISTLNWDKLDFLHIFVSSEIHKSLCQLGVDLSLFGHYEIINTFGLKAFYSKLNSKVKDSDLVFTVFGPNYLRVKSRKEIVGFAQFWMLDFDNPISKNMSLLSRNVLRIKFYVQWLFFLRADHYIVELEHVKNELNLIKGVNSENVSVVYNTVSSLYLDNQNWKSITINKKQADLSLGIVTRDYPHKNLEILPSVAHVLKLKYNLNVHFYTTLNELEWATKDKYFKRYVSTVGSLSPDECPSFYEQIDGVVFPSLLECFSATPLEAMVMNKPLFASDRGFVRDVCGDHAIYFDPLDVDNIALSIAKYFESDIKRSQSLQDARDHALTFSTAKGRAESYLKIIQKHLEG